MTTFWQDEGVSLTATPASSVDGCNSSVKASEPDCVQPPPYEVEQAGDVRVETRVETMVETKVETPLLSRPARDVVTAVTHQDINGMNAVSTVALKDVDVQMTSLSGYETYV